MISITEQIFVLMFKAVGAHCLTHLQLLIWCALLFIAIFVPFFFEVMVSWGYISISSWSGNFQLIVVHDDGSYQLILVLSLIKLEIEWNIRRASRYYWGLISLSFSFFKLIGLIFDNQVWIVLENKVCYVLLNMEK